MGEVVLLGKGLVGLAGAGAMMLAWPTRRFVQERLSDRQFTWSAFALLAISRLALFGVLYGVLHSPVQSDTREYYDWTKRMMAGESLYREIPSCYMPVFHYVLAGALMVWDSGASIVLLAIVLEIIALPIWLKVARRAFEEPVARMATVLYVVNPISLWSVAGSGQNQIWVSLLLGISLLLLLKQSEIASGLVLGASVVTVKFLTLLYGPAIALCASRPVRWMVAFLGLPAAVYAAYRLGGVNLAASGRIVAVETSSANLPYMVSLLGVDVRDPTFKHVASVVSAVVLLGLYGVIALRLRDMPRGGEPQVAGRRVMFLITLVQMAFMLVSKKSHAFYLQMCFFPVLLTLATAGFTPRRLAFFALFALAASVEQSFWFRDNWMQMNDFHVLWQHPMPPGFTYPMLATFFVLEVILLSFYVWTLVIAWRLALARARAPVRA